MKIDKLSVVVGAAILIVVVGYIIMQTLKVGPAQDLTANTTPTQKNSLPGNTSGSGSTTSESKNITVNTPVLNSTQSVPFDVKGKARVFENTVNYRVLDLNKNVLLEGSVIASAPDAGSYGDFTFTISAITLKGKMSLEVFDYSAKDGSEIDKVTIPLVLQ